MPGPACLRCRCFAHRGPIAGVTHQNRRLSDRGVQMERRVFCGWSTPELKAVAWRRFGGETQVAGRQRAPSMRRAAAPSNRASRRRTSTRRSALDGSSPLISIRKRSDAGCLPLPAFAQKRLERDLERVRGYCRTTGSPKRTVRWRRSTALSSWPTGTAVRSTASTPSRAISSTSVSAWSIRVASGAELRRGPSGV